MSHLYVKTTVFAAVIVALLLAACSSTPTTNNNNQGPVLVQENTLEATLSVPTRFLTPTPSREAPTSEVQSPLEMVTVDADFVLVTPTLPPSKTPTTTPTITQTPTTTPTPTVTVTSTDTRPLFPTSVIVPVTAAVAAPVDRICDSAWFFIEPRPAACPISEPTASGGVFQTFENGYMVWIGSTDAIYVMYNDSAQPRWQVFRDEFDEGMAEESPDYNNPPRPNIWQPRRGFGMLWRGNEAVRNRIGWATLEWEEPYSLQSQLSDDGSFYVSDPYDGVFGLFSGGTSWQRYSGFAGFNGG